MFMNFLRNNRIATGILTVLRIFLGWQWMTAGWGKITSETYSTQAYLTGIVQNEALMETFPAYHSFIVSFALPNAGIFSIIVAWGEFIVGIGLLLGLLTTAAAFFGIIMNFTFLFAGTVSSNPWLLVLTIFIVAAGHNAGKLGGDRWVIPFLQAKLFRGKKEFQQVA